MHAGMAISIAATMTLCVSMACMVSGQEAPSEAFEIGQRWVYRHQGPRPGSIEPNAIDGEKILQVISTFEQDGKKQWVIEERFTGDPNIIGRLFVDRDSLVGGLEIENDKNEVARLTYEMAVPYLAPEMEPNTEKTFETTLRMDSANFALPNKIVIQRLADETIETPAGRFTGCRHYRQTTQSTIDIKIAKIRTTEERQRWYHPTVNGMVKEVYRKSPVKFLTWSKPGYVATSVLTAFDKTEVQGTFDPAKSDSAGRPVQGQRRGWTGTGVPIAILAAAAILILRARTRRHKANT